MVGSFECPKDYHRMFDYDCSECPKTKNHSFLLKRYGKTATCRVSASICEGSS